MTMAQFIHDGAAIDYTPVSAASAGDVVVIGDLVGVVKIDIAAGAEGALSVMGVFDMAKTSGGGTAIAAGLPVYWDATNHVVTTDPANGVNKRAGETVTASLDGDTIQRVRLGVGKGCLIVGGQHTTVAASDTKVTGLAKVIACGCTLDSDPGDDPEWATASIGDQAGAPAAGSILIKTWKNTGGTDPTPLAATTFTKKVNWWAIGY